MIATDKSPDFSELDTQLQSKSPRQIIEYAFSQHENIAISFSGAEDVALIDIASKLRPDVQVFTLDTGRLHPETYQFIDRVRDHYKINIDVLAPQAAAVQALTTEKGFFSFYQDNHQECCGIRKIEPLKRKLANMDAWITGQRKDQSPGTRLGIPVIQTDENFAGPKRTLTKYNPLANWSSDDVWTHIRALEVPYNTLHDQGFISIGCQPCTRPVGPNQHEREGRWWWEDATKKECGLHNTNLNGG
ncbi:phosphoadenylyl-sulfate reductase [Marinagarivorans algicola]|uniref:phosphoadenylyl-sulfate reductase n=1 Tax=Marinagarivorans algicola TaxID=1513270 RepID=UPI0006B486DB|nr:phosphoadenylyl-sulfate reductase [Marinagarivorans algicola]